jgi:hypothetical protein
MGQDFTRQDYPRYHTLVWNQEIHEHMMSQVDLQLLGKKEGIGAMTQSSAHYIVGKVYHVDLDKLSV